MYLRTCKLKLQGFSKVTPYYKYVHVYMPLTGRQAGRPGHVLCLGSAHALAVLGN